MTDDEETTVSWKAIQPHWKVWSADDVEIGEVFLPVGDENTDIFDGLAIAHHGGPNVRAQLARPAALRQPGPGGAIQDGHVRLHDHGGGVAPPARAQRPETAEILPEKASLGALQERHRESTHERERTKPAARCPSRADGAEQT